MHIFNLINKILSKSKMKSNYFVELHNGAWHVTFVKRNWTNITTVITLKTDNHEQGFLIVFKIIAFQDFKTTYLHQKLYYAIMILRITFFGKHRSTPFFDTTEVSIRIIYCFNICKRVVVKHRPIQNNKLY